MSIELSLDIDILRQTHFRISRKSWPSVYFYFLKDFVLWGCKTTPVTSMCRSSPL